MPSKFYQHHSGSFGGSTNFIELLPNNTLVLHRKDGTKLAVEPGALYTSCIMPHAINMGYWVEIPDPRDITIVQE